MLIPLVLLLSTLDIIYRTSLLAEGDIRNLQGD